MSGVCGGWGAVGGCEGLWRLWGHGGCGVGGGILRFWGVMGDVGLVGLWGVVWGVSGLWGHGGLCRVMGAYEGCEEL